MFVDVKKKLIKGYLGLFVYLCLFIICIRRDYLKEKLFIKSNPSLILI